MATAQPEWRGLHYRTILELKSWLALAQPEEVIDPTRRIIDPHHHLWVSAHTGRYLLDDLLEDTGSGHDIRATVYLQASAMYRKDGPEQLKPVGETEFANGVAAMSASGNFGETRVCAAIVGYADLRLSSGAAEAIPAHIRAGGDRLRGFRQPIDNGGGIIAQKRGGTPSIPDLYRDPDFRGGLAIAQSQGLHFETWQFHFQLPDILDLARAFPKLTIVVGHCGGPLRVAHWAERLDEVWHVWHANIIELARAPNVIMKLGGLAMPYAGFNFHARERPPTGAEMAAEWRPWIAHCIENFGPDCCMFESNFPVDRQGCTYRAMWNAFKLLAAEYSEAEREAMFYGTANRVYRLGL